MAELVVVLCDRQWSPHCVTDTSGGPDGNTVFEARHSARKAGWQVTGHYASCPVCRKLSRPITTEDRRDR